jgi:hypothetical protein
MKTFFSARSLRLALGVVASLGSITLTSCATPANDGSQYLAPDQRPSSLPWNQPAAWEGKGQLGNVTTGAQGQGTYTGTGTH